MFYVYILRSKTNPEKTYIGFTQNLDRRLIEHNELKSEYTKKYAPWEILSHTTFESKNKALDYEKYLKSGSGKAFLKKHFL
jgi:predicted GIY-YIG superfamily endonuclease